MNDHNKRAVIYTRVSSREQVDEGNSLATQERLCRDYAGKFGFVVAELFEEQGESAKTALRTELQRMLDYCTKRKNKVDTVLTYKLDRIARNTDDYSYIRILLKRYGVEIKSITEHFENTPAGRFMENIIVNVSQFDNDVRAERTKNGMQEAVREGRFVFLAPLGYDNVRIGGKSNIVPNALAPFIRRTFEEVAKYNSSLEDIRVRMMKGGLTNRSGKAIAKSQFYRMLRTETYAGWITKYGERNRGSFKPIISDDLFGRVQRVLEGRTRRNFVYLRENPDFPLRRFVMIETGEKMTGCWSKGRNRKYPYYRTKKKGFLINRDRLEDLFIKKLDEYILTHEQLKQMRKYLREELLRATQEQRQQAAMLKKQIEELQRRQRTVIEKNDKGFISDRILQQQLEMLDNEIMKTEESLWRLNYDEKENLEDGIEDALRFMKNPAKWWQKSPFEIRLKLQWFAFPKGIVFFENKVRTIETALLLKAKEAFSVPLSQNGSFLNRSLNQKSEIIDLNDPKNKILITHEIVRLSNILSKESLNKT